MQEAQPFDRSGRRLPGGGRRAALLGACASMVLSACSGLPTVGGGSASGTREVIPQWPGTLTDAFAGEVVFLAMSLVDTPYRWGGNTPETGFDCSGLIVHVFRGAAGLALPRTVAQLAVVGREVPRSHLRSADLVFFNATGRFSHAGIYVGSSRFVHAPSSGGRVRLDSIDARYWAPRLAAVRRV